MDIKKMFDLRTIKKYALPVALAAIALILLIIPKGKKTERELMSVLLSEELEEKIESLCKSVDGVGYAKALVTLDTSEEYVYAKDSERNGDYLKITTVTPDEGGIGLYVISPRVRGVGIVCTDGDRPVMKKTVVELISAALGIDSSKISVAGS